MLVRRLVIAGAAAECLVGDADAGPACAEISFGFDGEVRGAETEPVFEEVGEAVAIEVGLVRE